MAVLTQAEWDARVASRANLWQYFRLDDAAGLPQDASGNNADMTAIAAGQSLAYEQPGPFPGALGIEVDANTGVPFSGVRSAVVNPPTNTANFAFPMTWETWFKPAVTPGNEWPIVCVGNMGLVMYADRKVGGARYANPNTVSGKSPTALTVGEWYFLMLTTSGNDMQLYIGNTLEVTWSNVVVDGWPIPNGSLLRIGSLPAFGEEHTCVAGVYSNMALYKSAGLTPDLDTVSTAPQVYRAGTVF